MDGTEAVEAAAAATEAAAEAAEATAEAAAETAAQEPSEVIATPAEAIVATAGAAVALADATAAAAELDAAERMRRIEQENEEWKAQISAEISALKAGQTELATALPAVALELQSIHDKLTPQTPETEVVAPEAETVTVQVSNEEEGDHQEAETQEEKARHRFL